MKPRLLLLLLVLGLCVCCAGTATAQTKRIDLSDVQKLVNLSDPDRKSTRLNSSHSQISYAVFCLKKNRYGGRELGDRHPHAPGDLLGRLGMSPGQDQGELLAPGPGGRVPAPDLFAKLGADDLQYL